MRKTKPGSTKEKKRKHGILGNKVGSMSDMPISIDMHYIYLYKVKTKDST